MMKIRIHTAWNAVLSAAVCYALSPVISMAAEDHITGSIPYAAHEYQVTKVSEDFLLVRALDQSDGPMFFSKQFPIQDLPAGEELQLGDLLVITYDGNTLQSYPGHFGEIYAAQFFGRRSDNSEDNS